MEATLSQPHNSKTPLPYRPWVHHCHTGLGFTIAIQALGSPLPYRPWVHHCHTGLGFTTAKQA